MEGTDGPASPGRLRVRPLRPVLSPSSRTNVSPNFSEHAGIDATELVAGSKGSDREVNLLSFATSSNIKQGYLEKAIFGNPAFMQFMPAHLQELARRLLDPTPSRRPTPQLVLDENFFAKGKSGRHLLCGGLTSPSSQTDGRVHRSSTPSKHAPFRSRAALDSPSGDGRISSLDRAQRAEVRAAAHPR